MSDGLNKWEKVVKTVKDHGERIAKVETIVAEMRLDLTMLTDDVHGAKRAPAAKGNGRKKRTRK